MPPPLDLSAVLCVHPSTNSSLYKFGRARQPRRREQRREPPLMVMVVVELLPSARWWWQFVAASASSSFPSPARHRKGGRFLRDATGRRFHQRHATSRGGDPVPPPAHCRVRASLPISLSISSPFSSLLFSSFHSHIQTPPTRHQLKVRDSVTSRLLSHPSFSLSLLYESNALHATLFIQSLISCGFSTFYISVIKFSTLSSGYTE